MSLTRFLAFLLGKKYEPCHACEVLIQQLAHERDEKRLLIDTLVSIVKPKEVEAPPVEINQIQQSSALFSRRRAALEERDRLAAHTLKNSTVLGKSDNEVQQLEKELGVEEGA